MKHIANVQYDYKLTVPNHYHKNKPSHAVKPKNKTISQHECITFTLKKQISPSIVPVMKS